MWKTYLRESIFSNTCPGNLLQHQLYSTGHLFEGSLNQMGTNSKTDKEEKEIKSSKDFEGRIPKKTIYLKF